MQEPMKEDSTEFVDAYLRGLTEGTPSLPALGVPYASHVDDESLDRLKITNKALRERVRLLDEARQHERGLTIQYVRALNEHAIYAVNQLRYVKIALFILCGFIAILALIDFMT